MLRIHSVTARMFLYRCGSGDLDFEWWTPDSLSPFAVVKDLIGIPAGDFIVRIYDGENVKRASGKLTVNQPAKPEEPKDPEDPKDPEEPKEPEEPKDPEEPEGTVCVCVCV